MSERDYSEDNCSDTPQNWNPPMTFQGLEKHAAVLATANCEGKPDFALCATGKE